MASQPSGSKRKTDDGAPAPAAKKARGGNAHAATIAVVNSILANPRSYPISGNEEAVRKSLVELAKYARSLEEQLAQLTGAPVAGSSTAAVAAKPTKSPAELEAAADKIRRAAQSGIKKQMSVRGFRYACIHLSLNPVPAPAQWKPSCKTGSAKWSYDGICPDPEVFGALLGLGGPPKFKMKKFSTDEFQKLVGPITGSVRCADVTLPVLSPESDVFVSFRAASGTIRYTLRAATSPYAGPTPASSSSVDLTVYTSPASSQLPDVAGLSIMISSSRPYGAAALIGFPNVPYPAAFDLQSTPPVVP